MCGSKGSQGVQNLGGRHGQEGKKENTTMVFAKTVASGGLDATLNMIGGGPKAVKKSKGTVQDKGYDDSNKYVVSDKRVNELLRAKDQTAQTDKLDRRL